jgi:Icc-related predicted phosphoesterase
MRIITFSDTHGKHDKLIYPDGDVLIFGGDICKRGDLKEVEHFVDFVSKLPHRHKIIIAGNHDFVLEDENEKVLAEKLIQDAGMIYLNDSGITLEGKTFWGSPIQPEFFNWAFNRRRGFEIRLHWDLIPEQVDVLITHGPPFGVLDRVKGGQHVGCEDLLLKVQKVKPKVHIFGHIHEDYGTCERYGITFINACSLNLKYEVVNPPIIYDLEN